MTEDPNLRHIERIQIREIGYFFNGWVRSASLLVCGGFYQLGYRGLSGESVFKCVKTCHTLTECAKSRRLHSSQ